MRTMKIKTKRTVVFISIIAIALIVGILIGLCWDLYDRFAAPYKYQQYIAKYSAEYDIPEEIIFAVIKIESSFRASVTSPVGAMGLMQMMPDTFEWLTGKYHLDENLSASSLYDPEVNIRYGTYYLRYLKDKFGDWSTVLAAYNAGEGNVAKWLADERYSSDGKTLHTIPFSETESYVKKVNNEIGIYRTLYE